MQRLIRDDFYYHSILSAFTKQAPPGICSIKSDSSHGTENHVCVFFKKDLLSDSFEIMSIRVNVKGCSSRGELFGKIPTTKTNQNKTLDQKNKVSASSLGR